MITKAKAKKLALEMCDAYLADKRITSKNDLPEKLRKKIAGRFARCPLCEYDNYRRGECKSCPLHDYRNRCGDVWYRNLHDAELMLFFHDIIKAW